MVNRTRVAVLGMLHAGPSSGYDLKKAFDERVQHFWNESPGQIYPALKKLEQEGLVASKATKRNGRARTVYSITAAGRAVFREWMLEPPARPVVRNEILLKLFFGECAEPSVLLGHVERIEATEREMQSRFEEFETEIDAVARSDEQRELWRLTLDSGRRIGEARLDWCRQARRVLRRIEKRRLP